MEAVGFTRVVVIAPRTRVDVALPSDLPVVELLPGILDMVGERSDDGGAAHDGWQVQLADGGGLDPSRSLRAHDVLDGTVLQLATGRAVRPEPVYDDVVDAIAAAVRDRRGGGDLREISGSLVVIVAVLASAVALATGRHSLLGAGAAAVAAVVAVTAAAAVSRNGAANLLATATAAGGVALAGVAGFLAVPGETSPEGLLLGGVAALVTAVTAIALVGTGALALSGLAVGAGFLAIGGVSGILWDAPASRHAIVAGTLALAMLIIVPWMSVRMARLPMPVIPTSADDLRDEQLGPDAADVGRKAALAAEYLDGMSLGCAVAASAGAALALTSGALFGMLYGSVVLALVLLRMRGLPGRRQRLGLLVTGTAGAAAGLVLLTLSAEESWGLPIAMACLVMAAVAVVAALAAPRRGSSPMRGRALDLLESFLLAAVLPLAAGALDLYATVRHL